MRKLIAVFIAFFGITIAQAGEYMIQPQVGGAELLLNETVSQEFANDQAIVYLYSQSQSENLKTSQGEVNQLMSKAQQKLALAFPEVKIESAGYSVNPVYSKPKEGEESVIKGWIARQVIKLTVNDVTAVSTVVQTAQEAGVALQNLQFGLSLKTRKDAQQKLTVEVLQSLNQRAQIIAATLGVPADSVKIVKLNFGGDNVRAMPMLARAYVADSANEMVATPRFEAGNSSLSASVQATLKINNK